MTESSDLPNNHSKRLATIRDEMRLEIGVFHDRINALISAEAFLLISFTMALTYSNSGWGGKLFWISPILSVVGFVLAILAWPGVSTSFKIIVEWNQLFVDALNEAHASSTLVWRPSLFADGDRRTHADHRRSMLFARYVPATFVVAWAILAGVVLTSPWDRRKIGGAADSWVFSRLFSGRGWMRGLDVEVGKDRG